MSQEEFVPQDQSELMPTPEEIAAGGSKRTSKKNQPKVQAPTVDTELVNGGVCLTMTTEEYMEYSKANGTYMGRPLGEKTQMTPEEFVVLANGGWTPKMMMDKHGIDLKELQEVANRVPLIMQLKRPIVVTEKAIKW